MYGQGDDCFACISTFVKLPNCTSFTYDDKLELLLFRPMQLV